MSRTAVVGNDRIAVRAVLVASVSLALFAGCSDRDTANDGRGESTTSGVPVSGLYEVPLGDEAANYHTDELVAIQDIALVDGKYELVYQVGSDALRRIEAANGDIGVSLSLGDGEDRGEFTVRENMAERRAPNEVWHEVLIDADHGTQPVRLRTELTPEQAAAGDYGDICAFVVLKAWTGERSDVEFHIDCARLPE